MRASREEMRQSHRRIVEGAARLFRERGVDNTSVADVMESAGLTHGGFYRHFEAKDALVLAATKSAFAELRALMERHLRDKEPTAALQIFRSYYLSEGHLTHPATACPVATLAGEVARGGEELKREFGAGVKEVLAKLAQSHTGNKKERQARAVRDFATLVGAAVIARACDPETAHAVLAECRSK